MKITKVSAILSLLITCSAYGVSPVLVKDIAPGTASSFPSSLTAVGASLYFLVGGDLWLSGGLASNTVLLREATDPRTSVHAPVTSMVSGANILYFLVDVDADSENFLFDVAQLWRSDGTPDGTTKIKDVTIGGTGNLTDGEQMIFVNGKVYFDGVDAQNGRELWVSDGTDAGTHILKDINPGAAATTPPVEFTNVNGTLYFVADDGIHGPQLWKSNGTTSGTVMVSSVDTQPSNLTAEGNKLYFTLNRSILSEENSELWMTDGTGAGTTFVAGFLFPSTLMELTTVGQELYFVVESSGGSDLWKSNGTFSGTTHILGPLVYSDTSANPLSLTSFKGELYFVADDGGHGYELWKSNGTVAGTGILKDINLTGSSSPQDLTVVSNLLLFSAYTSSHGTELWQSDGTSTGTTLAGDINPGTGDGDPSELTNVRGILYFSANDGNRGFELWKYGLADIPPSDVQLGNISTRLNVGLGDNVLIGGFIITGTQAKKVIIRGIGPSLAQAGVSGPLVNPYLELHNSSGATIATNDNWQDNANKQAIVASGLQPSNPKESAILKALTPGAYTVIVSGVNSGTGVGLVEVYDLDQSVDSKLGNISTRGDVQTGDNVMIGGLIVLGNGPTRTLVRAIGPSLPLNNTLADPTLELHDSNGTITASNDNWKDTQEAVIQATKLAPSDDRESAIVATLSPGAYTAIIRGKDNTTGVALIEAYQLDK